MSSWPCAGASPRAGTFDVVLISVHVSCFSCEMNSNILPGRDALAVGEWHASKQFRGSRGNACRGTKVTEVSFSRCSAHDEISFLCSLFHRASSCRFASVSQGARCTGESLTCAAWHATRPFIPCACLKTAAKLGSVWMRLLSTNLVVAGHPAYEEWPSRRQEQPGRGSAQAVGGRFPEGRNMF